MMGLGIPQVRILIRPKAVWNLRRQLLNPIDSRLKILARKRVRYRHTLNLGAVQSQNVEILFGSLGIHHTHKPQAEVPAHLSQPDSHVPRAGLDYGRAWTKLPRYNGIFDDGQRSSIFYASAGIKPLKFGEQSKARIRKNPIEPRHWGIADFRDYISDHRFLSHLSESVVPDNRKLNGDYRRCDNGHLQRISFQTSIGFVESAPVIIINDVFRLI